MHTQLMNQKTRLVSLWVSGVPYVYRMHYLYTTVYD